MENINALLDECEKDDGDLGVIEALAEKVAAKTVLEAKTPYKSADFDGAHWKAMDVLSDLAIKRHPTRWKCADLAWTLLQDAGAARTSPTGYEAMPVETAYKWANIKLVYKDGKTLVAQFKYDEPSKDVQEAESVPVGWEFYKDGTESL